MSVDLFGQEVRPEAPTVEALALFDAGEPVQLSCPGCGALVRESRPCAECVGRGVEAPGLFDEATR